LEHFNAKDQEYQNLMNFIYEKLQLLMNTLPNDCIDSLEILSNSNDIYSLKIIPSSGYSFLSNSDYYDNGNIILIDIDIYSYIEFNGIDLDSFFSQLQSSIDTEKYSKEQFNQWIITPEFKDYVGANLKIANGNKIETTKIKSISYDEINNELKITPTNAYRFRLLDNSANATINAEGELIISNLKLFEYINFTNLQSLYTGMQDYIDNIKWSTNEFSDYVLDTKNFESLKTLISNYLYVSATQKIDANKITNISFANGNLIIFLDSDYAIYNADLYENVSLSTNTLTIKNLKYFKVVDLVKLDTLFNAVQSLIKTSKYTWEEFKEYLTNNLEDFKSLIANNLFINEQDKLLVSEIINISFETNNDIRISLNNNYTKYNLETNQNFELDGTDLIIKNLTYYTAIEFNALNNLFDAIQDSIKNKKFTKNEFDNFSINNNEELKELIADNLYISDSEKLNVTDIVSATFTIATNELNIVLNNNYLKYSASLDSNIALTDDTLTVRNLKYYNAISFVDIQQLFSAIQNYITTNQYTPDEFKEFSNVQGKETIKQLISDNLSISSSSTLDIDNIIDVNVNDHYQLKISLNNDYKKYSMTENDNVTLENDVLTVDNLVYYSTTNISNLAAVFDYLQEIVLTNQYTPDEFRTYLNANMDTIKNDIASKILISETETINVSEIISISLNSSNKFEIRLDSVNKKYTIEEYENASLTGTTISINNLEFYTSIKFSNLSNLRSKIQDIISKRGYTESDFRDYISNNKTEFKNYISNHLTKSVSGPGSWNINQISNVEYSSGSVKVTFDIPTNYKYSFESYSNATFVNNVLEIKSYSFYSP
ncbi:MAG: hypothetical protein K2K73_00785, partial [Ureaplasma sp.]|nr:hypothetical protein [Ureaplasma sp.]